MKNLYHFRDIKNLNIGDSVLIFGINSHTGKETRGIVARFNGSKTVPVESSQTATMEDPDYLMLSLDGREPQIGILCFTGENYWYTPIASLADKLDDNIVEWIRQNKR